MGGLRICISSRFPEDAGASTQTHFENNLRYQELLRCHLPMQETQEMWVQSLSVEDTLEEKMETHSSILAWKNPMEMG